MIFQTEFPDFDPSTLPATQKFDRATWLAQEAGKALALAGANVACAEQYKAVAGQLMAESLALRTARNRA